MFTSIFKLQQSKKLSSARFFGKILGTGKDYYVVEAKYVDEPERPEPEEGAPPPPVPLEASSEGCNTFAYFVTNDPAQEWAELPQVKPDQISAAMLIRKLFTGDLQADVRAYPPFPGKEKEYLRAQIVRPHHTPLPHPHLRHPWPAAPPLHLPLSLAPPHGFQSAAFCARCPCAPSRHLTTAARRHASGLPRRFAPRTSSPWTRKTRASCPSATAAWVPSWIGSSTLAPPPPPPGRFNAANTRSYSLARFADRRKTKRRLFAASYVCDVASRSLVQVQRECARHWPVRGHAPALTLVSSVAGQHTHRVACAHSRMHFHSR